MISTAQSRPTTRLNIKTSGDTGTIVPEGWIGEWVVLLWGATGSLPLRSDHSQALHSGSAQGSQWVHPYHGRRYP